MTSERFPGTRLDFIKSQPWGNQDRGQRMVPMGVSAIDSSPSGSPTRTYTLPDQFAIPGAVVLAYGYSQEGPPNFASGMNAVWRFLASAKNQVSSFACVGLMLGVMPRNIPTSRSVSVTYDSVTTGGVGFMLLAARRVPLFLGSASANGNGSSTDNLSVSAVGGRLAVSMNFGRSGLAAEPSGWKTELTSGFIRIVSKQILPGDPVSCSWSAVGEHASTLVVLG